MCLFYPISTDKINKLFHVFQKCNFASSFYLPLEESQSGNSEGTDWAPERKDHVIFMHSSVQGT